MSRSRSLRFAALVALAASLAPALSGAVLGAQGLDRWDPTGLTMSRPELTSLLTRYEAAAASPAYSEPLRESARSEAERIRQRLQSGDFRVGDRIVLDVPAQPTWPDTLVVAPGPSVVLPALEPISLEGVLRSELTDHLRATLSEFVRDPRMRATAMIRLSVQGAVSNPGFYVIDANALLDDAVMIAGGLTQEAVLDEMVIVRGAETLWDGREVETALAGGRTLDQLGLRAGDQIRIPAEEPGRGIWWEVGRIGILITSATLLGVRAF